MRISTVLDVNDSVCVLIYKDDVKTAYLNGILNEKTYMEAPKGYELPTDQVYLIKRSIYGLPQSGRRWYDKFSKVLEEAGLRRLKPDPSVYTKEMNDEYIHIGVYADDILVVASPEKILDKIIAKVKKEN